MASNIATINEYRLIGNSDNQSKLAFVTATLANGITDKDRLYDEITAALNNMARPVKDSFRWLDGAKNYVAGFVVPHREVRSVEAGKEVAGYREIASNIYMDDKDKSLWDMKEGATGKYLARQGADDLGHLLETARVSPRGSTPRMYSVQRASVEAPTKDSVQYVAFVNAARYGADMDYGVVLGHNDEGDAVVVAHSVRKAIAVPQDMVVAVVELNTDSIPSIRGKVKAANVYDAKLTPEEYWKLQYSYAPEYMNLVLKQVQEMAAL